jgi:hypothetical protein
VQVGFMKNGSAFAAHNFAVAGTSAQGAAFSIYDECDGDDFYEVYIFHGAGVSLTVDTGATLSFSGARLR